MSLQHVITTRRLAYFYKKLLTVFVKQRTGYDLSQNDYVNADKSKLTAIEAGAQVNKIETIQMNGTSQSIANKTVNLDLSKYALKTDLTNVYKFKGSVASYAALPTSGQTGGDVYNVVAADTTHDINAGDNVAWNSSNNTWDNLRGIIDLSAYATKTQLQTAMNSIQLATDSDIESIVV
jgi:hypothetical protein